MEDCNCCALIRPAREDELVDVYSIEVESFENPYPLSYFRFLYALGKRELFLVSLDCKGRVTGYIAAIPLRRHVCHIASIAVTKRCRRRHVGSALLQSIFEVCYDKGYDVFMLEVSYGNKPAVLMYLSHGFKIIGIKPNYYGYSRHALVMVRLEDSQWLKL